MPATVPATRVSTAPRRFLAWLAEQRRGAVIVMLVMLVGVLSVARPSFASPQNLKDLLVQSAPVMIVGCGMTLVVLTGEIDISVGSLLGFLAALLGVMSSPQHLGLPTGVVVVLTLAAGTGVGLINGLLVTVGRVPSIVATLGMLTVLRGVTHFVLGGDWVTDLPPSLRALGTGSFAGVPICIWTAAAVAAIGIFVTRKTELGLRLRAIGGNPAAAAIARVPVGRVKVLAFAATGFLTAVTALVCVTQQSVIESGIGAGFELTVITAVVVGGTSIQGGTGGIAGTLLAAVLLGSIRTALVFLNLGETATYWERAIQGCFILVAVLADHYAAASARRPRRVGVRV